MKIIVAKIGKANITVKSQAPKTTLGIKGLVSKYYFINLEVPQDEHDELMGKEFELKSYDIKEVVSADGQTFEFLENIVEA